MRFDEQGQSIPMTDRQIYDHTRRWLLIGAVILVVAPLLAWGGSVAFSDIWGRGEAHKQINRPDNRIFAQEEFHQLLNDIAAYDQQIGIQQAVLGAHLAQDGEHDRLAQVVAGIRAQCVSTRAQYDAEAQKISKARFRDAGLPDHIDETDPATDCR